MKTHYATASGILLAVVLWEPCRTRAADPVDFGSAAGFTILAGSAITSIGGGSVHGDVGLSPTTGAAITGLTAAQVNGVIYTVDTAGPAGSVEDAARLIAAKNDLTTAFNTTAGLPVDFIAATELGGTTKVPGVYDSASGTFGITGILTLDAGGDSGAVFIFKMATTLITAANSSVILINGAIASNVFWQVGSSATLGASSSFKGVIMADQSITMGIGSLVEGRMLASVGMVTFDSQTSLDPSPTLAVITAVRARVEDGVAVISWDVSLELDTAGYYLERWSGGIWQRVNADLVSPQLFVSGIRTYELADPGAIPGTTQRYRIIELDNRGLLLPYGPYDLELAGTEPPGADPVLRVSRIEPLPHGLRLTWSSTAGRVYAVEMTSSLTQPFVAIASGIAAAPPENIFVVPVDAGSAKGAYFRVVVSPP